MAQPIDEKTAKTPSTHQVHELEACIQRHAGHNKSDGQRLACLDGLRGVGCVLVYLLHYENCSHSWGERSVMESAFGYKGRYHLSAFPFVRHIFTGGHHAVTTFFVISGYALAYGPLRCIHSKDDARFLRKLSSAVFRRWFRLWIPVVATTFIYMLVLHIFDMKTTQTMKDNLRDELPNWFDVIRTSSFLYTESYFNTYNFHVWTIPIEFRGSLVVYCALLTLHAASRDVRLFCQVTLIWYFTYIVDGWFCALFTAGMLLCELDLLAEADDLPQFIKRLRPLRSFAYPILLAISIYLGGVPCYDHTKEYLQLNPGWYWLYYLKPAVMKDPRWIYRCIAAILTVLTVPRIPTVRAFFESRFCQYLGKISFGFYLVHGPVLYTLGDRLFAASGRINDTHASLMPRWINLLPLPSSGPIGLEINFLVPHLIIFPVTLWLGDLVTRLIDEPSIRFCQWLQNLVVDDTRMEKRTSPERAV